MSRLTDALHRLSHILHLDVADPVALLREEEAKFRAIVVEEVNALEARIKLIEERLTPASDKPAAAPAPAPDLADALAETPKSKKTADATD